MFHFSLPAAAGRWAFRLSAVSAITAALVLSGCSRQEAVQEPVRAVKVLTVGGSDVNVQGEYAAEVRARVESRLGFRVGGKLVQRQAEVGQRVNAGQVLAQIDAQDYQLGAQAALAQVAAAQTQRDLALSDFKRYESLKAQNFISGAELERREASLKAADAALNQAKAQAQVAAEVLQLRGVLAVDGDLLLIEAVHKVIRAGLDDVGAEQPTITTTTTASLRLQLGIFQ